MKRKIEEAIKEAKEMLILYLGGSKEKAIYILIGSFIFSCISSFLFYLVTFFLHINFSLSNKFVYFILFILNIPLFIILIMIIIFYIFAILFHCFIPFLLFLGEKICYIFNIIEVKGKKEREG